MSEVIQAALQAQSVQQATKQTPDQGTQTPDGQTTPGKSEERKSVSPGFSQLAAKERELVRKQREFAADREKLAQERTEYDAWKASKEKAKLNPAEYLEKSGLSYEEVTQFYLNGGKPTADAQVSDVKSQLDQLSQEFAEREQKALEAEKFRSEQEMERAVAQFDESLNKFLETNKETYELTNLYGGQGLAKALIQEHFDKTEKVMSFEEAAKLVEGHFESLVEETAKTSKKFQSKYRAVEAEATTKDPGFQAPRSLSNQLTSSAVPSMLPAKTENDRLKRAMAKLDGK